MKKLFLYYSLTGNGDKVADYFKNNNYTIEKISVKKVLPKNFIFRILIGGYKAMINYNEELINFKDPSDDYDRIIIGSPIWNDRLSTPISSALRLIKSKNIDFVLYSGSGNAKHAIDYINANYPNSKIIVLKEPNKNENKIDKLNDFLEKR